VVDGMRYAFAAMRACSMAAFGDDDSEVYSWVQQLTVRLVAENMDAATLSSVSSSVMFH
jgi:hypothetical protein